MIALVQATFGSIALSDLDIHQAGFGQIGWIQEPTAACRRDGRTVRAERPGIVCRHRSLPRPHNRRLQACVFAKRSWLFFEQRLRNARNTTQSPNKSQRKSPQNATIEHHRAPPKFSLLFREINQRKRENPKYRQKRNSSARMTIKKTIISLLLTYPSSTRQISLKDFLPSTDHAL